MLHLLHWILHSLGFCRHTPGILVTLADGIQIYGDIKMLGITTVQKATVTLRPVDAKGQPAEIDISDLVPTWTVDDPDVVTVEVDPTNPLKATIYGVGVGTALVSAEFDADLDEGEQRSIWGNIEVEVFPAEAVLATIEIGEVSNQDADRVAIG